MKTQDQIRIKVFKIKTPLATYYDCDEQKQFAQGVTKWDELTPDEYVRLNEAVTLANYRKNAKYHYFVVHEVTDYPEIFDTAAEFTKHMEAEEENRRKQEAISKAKRESDKLERKRKQLAKLKKELEAK